MTFLINCSNLRKGGGLQVGDSICGCLQLYLQHRFVVVLSSYMDDTARNIKGYENVSIVRHDIRNGWRTLLLGRDEILDALVKENGIAAVLTVFGPARWKPRCPHLCGFARAQLLLGDSPYYTRMPFLKRVRERLQNMMMAYMFRRGTDAFWSENPYISQKLEKRFKGVRVVTATNCYNQVFDRPEMQREHPLSPFDGCTLLSVNASYAHKNLGITIGIAGHLKRRHPHFGFRFVLTVTESDLPPIPEDLRPHFLLIGKTALAECPSLYRQCDIMFQPTLLECFTATYPEAMRMERPIITTDIEFARGLCGDAARYYSPLSATEAAEAIYEVATDGLLRRRLVEAGRKRLETYDNYIRRAERLAGTLETLAKNSQ